MSAVMEIDFLVLTVVIAYAEMPNCKWTPFTLNGRQEEE